MWIPRGRVFDLFENEDSPVEKREKDYYLKICQMSEGIKIV